MFQTFQVSQEKEEVAHLFKELCYSLWPACSAFSFLSLLAVLLSPITSHVLILISNRTKEVQQLSGGSLS